MNGWQRFAIVLLSAFAVMVLFPEFDAAGWTFIGMAIAMWTGAIVILSLISNMFGIYRLESLNKFISFVLLFVIFGSFLWYFPQKDKVSPINKLKHGEFPTKADIDKGLKRFKFNFDFVRRNVHRKENFINQEMDKEKVKKSVQKKAAEAGEEFLDSFEIEVEE